MITTVTLNPALDKTITVESLEYGSVNRVQKSLVDTGGKGINVSKVLGKLGSPTTAIGFLGDRNKNQMLQLLEIEKIETEFIYVDEDTRTNTIIVELEKKITTNINEEGFFIDEAHAAKMKELVIQYAQKSTHMVFSGSAPKGIDVQIYKELIELVRDLTLTVLDADDDLLLEGIKASPYLIKPNLHELENAYDVILETNEAIIQLSRRIIQEHHIHIVLISMGGDGCLLVTHDEAYKALPIPVEVMSTVGAGDSLVGGFLHGLANNLSLQACLAYGTVCGALAVTREGVGNFEIEEVKELIEKVVIQKL